MNYAKSYIDNYRKYAAAVVAAKAARQEAEDEYNDHSITKTTFEGKLEKILERTPNEIEYRKATDKIVADFDAAYSAWIAPDGSKVDTADLAVLNPTFITSAADLQHLADKHRKNPTMCKPIRKYAVEKGFNIRILDVDAPLRAMNTLKMLVQKALNDFNGYSANCLASDKFCQKFIDMMDVLDGKELFTDTLEE